MALESATYISDLVSTNPTNSDPKSAGDDHIRLLKSTVKATFPNVSGAVTPTHTELNYVDGVTSAIQTQLDAKAPTASPTFTGTATLPATTSIGNVSSTELGYLDGVTSAIQTQLDAKANLSGATHTGTHSFTGATITVPTQTAGDSSTNAASTAFVAATAFSSALPAQTGNAGKYVTTNGTTASWATVPLPQVNYSARTSNTILAAGDSGYLIDVTSGTFTQTITAAATLGAGWYCYLRNSTGGRDVVVNGTFAADANWTKGAGWTISGGVANAASASGTLTAAVAPLTAGNTYQLTYTITRSAGSITSPAGVSKSAGGTYTETFTAGSTALTFTPTTFTGTVDNVICIDLTGTQITLDPNASELIGGVTTAVMNPGDVWLVSCTGTAFQLNRLAGMNSQIYTSGSGNFIVPAGVYRIWVECWGGGGGLNNPTFSGGAGGGAYSAGWFSVTPGQTISYAVGAGGTSAPTNGGNTTFLSMIASGGTACNNTGTSNVGGNAAGGAINISGQTGIGGSPAMGGASPLANFPTYAYTAGSYNGTYPGGGASCNGASGASNGADGRIIIQWV